MFNSSTFKPGFAHNVTELNATLIGNARNRNIFVESESSKAHPYANMFAYLLTLHILNAFFGSASGPLLDTWVLQLLGPERKGYYGRQRLWASVACGLSSFLTGLLADQSGSYLGGFILFFASIIIHIGVCAVAMRFNYTPANQEKPVETTSEAVSETRKAPSLDTTSQTSGKDSEKKMVESSLGSESTLAAADTPGITFFFKDRRIVMWYFIVLVMGLSNSIIGNFLWIFMHNSLQANSTLIGVTAPARVTLELPFFFFASTVGAY